jgi:excisionase family DNA binding protein
MAYTPRMNDQLTDALLDRLQSYDRALNAAEVAELLNVSKSAVFRLCEQRAIPHFRIGHLVRFVPALIAKWLIEKQGVVTLKKMMKREEREAKRA